MPHIDTIVSYVADAIRENAGADVPEAEEYARHAVAAVRRFDLEHKYQPLNARAWRPETRA